MPCGVQHFCHADANLYLLYLLFSISLLLFFVHFIRACTRASAHALSNNRNNIICIDEGADNARCVKVKETSALQKMECGCRFVKLVQIRGRTQSGCFTNL